MANRGPFCRILLVAALGLTSAAGARAQAGDRPGEDQPELPEPLHLDPSPPLSAPESLGAFVVERGFRIECVACEPLVRDPVAIAFDERGRIWVVEMSGFMLDADGSRERAPIGTVAILSDDDGDGRMDRRTEFLDHLVLPRAVMPCFGGALVIAPPDLIFARDEDGDGRADVVLTVATEFGGIESPEHAGNGLLLGLDNWTHVSQHPFRFRFDGEVMQSQRTPGHGQWGITKDDQGRMYYTTNSDPLRMDAVPLRYASRNPHQSGLEGVNERVVEDVRVWPARPTPGVNRGYQEGFLSDGRLTAFTAACGPSIERGGLFPETHRGNAFVCEPAANLVKRFVLEEEPNGGVRGHPAHIGSEFLASTDERFRPVNSCFGPDGALYVVDMYRGVLQHRVFLTTFLRKQIDDRQLESPVGLGRIYRIVPEAAGWSSPIDLSMLTSAELVDRLSHANGWVRDTAQRLLVERGSSDCASLVRGALNATSGTLGQLHMLWTLEGLGALTFAEVVAACSDSSSMVRVHGLRLLEPWLAEPQALSIAANLTRDEHRSVRLQAVLSLGEQHGDYSFSVLIDVMREQAGDEAIRSAVVSSIAGREIGFLRAVVTDERWREVAPGHREAVLAVAECVNESDDPKRLQTLLELLSGVDRECEWIAIALLNQIAQRRRVGSDAPRAVMLPREPDGWVRMLGRPGPIAVAASRVDTILRWPGRAARGDVVPRPLSSEELASFDRGWRLYDAFCFSCHRDDGRGQPGIAPSLAGAEWVLGSEERLIRILLHGMRGPMERDGVDFNADMPPSPAKSDGAIADVLTFIRRAWGNEASPVIAASVRTVREAAVEHVGPWTVAELDEIENQP